ncbi:unnamed protein product [Arabidopsis arenosa]|uniref:TF-B3 domain-containing protein n=1 Tax=Arabidopsis arenosa TaxID=38785 RepID=A0A8S2A1W3_ARAAE|nr:unnamed protein product [Arabidopsis arenosa]
MFNVSACDIRDKPSPSNNDIKRLANLFREEFQRRRTEEGDDQDNTDGTRRLANLLRENNGRMSLGRGWVEFVKANGLKIGQYFTLESIWANDTPILKLSSTNDSKSDIRQRRENLPEANEKEFVSTEASDGNEPEKDMNTEEMINQSSLIDNRFVILALEPEDAKAGMLYLPSHFMKANGIDKVGKIYMLGTNEMEWWWGNLLTRDGIVSTIRFFGSCTTPKWSDVEENKGLELEN